MPHYNQESQTFELHIQGCTLHCFTMQDLIQQAKDIYNINLLTILN